MSNYFTGASATQKGLAADASSNTTVNNSSSSTSLYSIRVTTGVANEATIDICGSGVNNQEWLPIASGNAIKLRVDTHENDGTFISSYVTPALYGNDISAVAGNVAATPGNIGKKLTAAPFLPMYFRTLCGDGLTTATNRAIRVTLKDADKIKNGMKLNVMAKVAAATANVNISSLDVSFNTGAATSAGQPLINGGPLGADAAIPAFTSAMTKNANGTSGDVKVFTSVPMFKNGGDGIDLSNATFRIKESGAGGAETFLTLTIPAAEVAGTQLPNADGLYEYSLGSITSAVNKSYRVMNTSVLDKFLVYGYAMQNSTNDLINISNKPALIAQNTPAEIDINSDSFGQAAAWRDGTHATVKIVTAPSAAEGVKTLKKYEARWATKAQVDTLGTVPLNFDTFRTHFANQVNTQTDICNTTGAVEQFVNLTGLTPSVVQANGLSDNSTRYGVFVRAFTQDDDGNFVEGAKIAQDASANMFASPTGLVSSVTASATGVSLGFFVSGVPDAPTPVAIKTGSDLVVSGVTGTTSANQDASMDNIVTIAYNDYNVNQRGSNYDSLRYAIVRASDAQYGDSLVDTSFSVAAGTNAWNGNDSTAESTIITGVGAVLNEYDTVNSVWKARAAGLKDASNGDTFSIAYAFDNSNGMGYRSPWVNFVPSAHPDAQANLYGLDASTNLHGTAAGDTTAAGWGYGIDPTSAASFKVINNATFIGYDGTAKKERLNLDNAGKLAFGFSLLDASGQDAKAAGQPYKSPIALSGGKEVSSIRYFVDRSAAINSEATTLQAARVYGHADRDVSGLTGGTVITAAFAQSQAANKDTNRLTITQGYDASGALANLKNGQRYDIRFGAVNANGFNDLSLLTLEGFAPMGEIQAVKNLRVGANAIINDSANKATFDISFDDLSGVAEHGGHLINRYTIKVTQDRGAGDVTLLTAATGTQNATSGTSIAASYQKADAATARGFAVTASTAIALPGYPMKVTVTPVATSAGSAGANVDGINYTYQGGVNKTGASSTITIPGPALPLGSQHDEVRSLQVTPQNEKLKVSFYKPQNDAMKNLYQGAPAVNAYYIYQYDMSLNTITGTASATLSERAMSRSVTVVNDATDIAADYLEKELSGVNGKCYVVAVHTQWRYGVNNNTLQLSQGVYHTNTASASGTDDPSLNSGLYTLPKVARTTAANILAVSDCAVPRDAPIITATNSSMRFDDNGSLITVGAMIQVAPALVGGANTTTGFYFDLCSGTVGTTVVNQQSSGGHFIARRTYDICATTVLGTNWATEKNFVVIQNAAGSAYVKRNIA